MANSMKITKINCYNINLFQQLKIAIAIVIDIEILSLLCSQIIINGFLTVL